MQAGNVATVAYGIWTKKMLISVQIRGRIEDEEGAEQGGGRHWLRALAAIRATFSRGSSAYCDANDEREQTPNQILTGMDGFDASTGVIVLAATNRLDVLDAALLRPGRFDRRVPVQAPDKPGRQQILRVHTRGLPLLPGVDLDGVAAPTAGIVGDDLSFRRQADAVRARRREHPLRRATLLESAMSSPVTAPTEAARDGRGTSYSAWSCSGVFGFDELKKADLKHGGPGAGRAVGGMTLRLRSAFVHRHDQTGRRASSRPRDERHSRR